MLIFAHAGLTLGAAALTAGVLQYRKRPSCRVRSWFTALAGYLDIRWLLVGSLLPDIIDKPLGQFILRDYIGTGRAYAHTLVFLILMFVIGIIVKVRFHHTWGLALALGTLAHHLLDYLWVSPEVLFWPIFGWRFEPIDVYHWWPHLLEGLVHSPYILIPEIAGFVIVVWFGWRLLQQNKIGAFILHGDIGT